MSFARSRLSRSIKWGHLVYLSNGPVLLIRAEEECPVRLLAREAPWQKSSPGLKPGGKYEMATLELRNDMTVDAETVGQLAKMAATLNAKLGDPTNL
jgi:hypothetical protein